MSPTFQSGPTDSSVDGGMSRSGPRPGEGAPAWGALIWAVPMLYVFWDPFQRRAHWAEWLVTGLALAGFLAFYTIGLIHWSNRRIVIRVCIAVTVLAATFTLYRPAGVIFFALVAAFGPFAVDGNIRRSAAIILGTAALLVVEWWMVWPPSTFPYVIGVEALFVGAGTTFVARQQIALRRSHRMAERERIARDLHDILGHTLSVIIVKSELAGRLIDVEVDRAKREIEDVERISRDALSEVREAIAGYRAGDVRAELDRARATLESAGIAVECEYEPGVLPAAQERVLVFALREAVTNILRHAGATRCRLELRSIDGIWRLEVHDNGRGGIHEEGMGMRGIRERVAAIGGRVAWTPTGGTELTISVPMATSTEPGGGR